MGGVRLQIELLFREVMATVKPHLPLPEASEIRSAFLKLLGMIDTEQRTVSRSAPNSHAIVSSIMHDFIHESIHELVPACEAAKAHKQTIADRQTIKNLHGDVYVLQMELQVVKARLERLNLAAREMMKKMNKELISVRKIAGITAVFDYEKYIEAIDEERSHLPGRIRELEEEKGKLLEGHDAQVAKLYRMHEAQLLVLEDGKRGIAQQFIKEREKTNISIRKFSQTLHNNFKIIRILMDDVRALLTGIGDGQGFLETTKTIQKALLDIKGNDISLTTFLTRYSGSILTADGSEESFTKARKTITESINNDADFKRQWKDSNLHKSLMFVFESLRQAHAQRASALEMAAGIQEQAAVDIAKAVEAAKVVREEAKAAERHAAVLHAGAMEAAALAHENNIKSSLRKTSIAASAVVSSSLDSASAIDVSFEAHPPPENRRNTVLGASLLIAHPPHRSPSPDANPNSEPMRLRAEEVQEALKMMKELLNDAHNKAIFSEEQANIIKQAELERLVLRKGEMNFVLIRIVKRARLKLLFKRATVLENQAMNFLLSDITLSNDMKQLVKAEEALAEEVSAISGHMLALREAHTKNMQDIIAKLPMALMHRVVSVRQIETDRVKESNMKVLRSRLNVVPMKRHSVSPAIPVGGIGESPLKNRKARRSIFALQEEQYEPEFDDMSLMRITSAAPHDPSNLPRPGMVTSDSEVMTKSRQMLESHTEAVVKVTPHPPVKVVTGTTVPRRESLMNTDRRKSIKSPLIIPTKSLTFTE